VTSSATGSVTSRIDLRLPKNWSIHYEEQWGSLQASLQWTLRQYPDATQYGWLADDTYPRTDRMGQASRAGGRRMVSLLRERPLVR
jgi:hypothetical protein